MFYKCLSVHQLLADFCMELFSRRYLIPKAGFL